MQVNRATQSGRQVRQSSSPLLQQIRDLARAKHMSIRTEDAYVHWVEDYLRYHRQLAGKWCHPNELGSQQINAFLTHLAVDQHEAASNQNRALSAIVNMQPSAILVL